MHSDVFWIDGRAFLDIVSHFFRRSHALGGLRKLEVSQESTSLLALQNQYILYAFDGYKRLQSKILNYLFLRVAIIMTLGVVGGVS